MLQKLKRLQYGARVKLYSADQMQMVDVAGRRTQLLRGGKGEPLVYLHSAIGETMWLPFHQGLAAEWEVIAPAHPGFAASEGYDEIDGMEDVIFHYLDLFAALGLERFHLVGSSFGGWIAAEFAVRYPERVSRLVLVDSAGLWLDEAPPPDFFARLQDAPALRRMMLHAPDSFLGDLLFPEDPADERIEAGLRAMQAIARIGWNPFLHNPKLRSRLRRITSPTLLLWGANDAVFPSLYAQAFREAIPGSIIQLIERCGHLPMFEQEAKFVASVTRFLRSA